jgi:hypothetical protein
MIAITLFLLIFVALQTPQPAATPYAEIVALQNRALQPNATNRELDHRRSIEIAQMLGRPRLLAVLFQRLGRTLEGRNVQEAVVAYETAMKVLASDRTLDAKKELDRIAATPKDPVAGRTDPATADLYSESLDKELRDAEADPDLVAQLLIDIGND